MADLDDSDVDPTLAANFSALMGGRSVAALRQEMADKGYTIGSGAIQSAKVGSRGLRLETLQKFADFFGCSVYDLVTPADSRESWPFGNTLTPAQFFALDAGAVQAALDVLVSASKRQAVMKKLGAPAPAADDRVGAFIKPAPHHPDAPDTGFGDELSESTAAKFVAKHGRPEVFHPGKKVTPAKGKKAK